MIHPRPEYQTDKEPLVSYIQKENARSPSWICLYSGRSYTEHGIFGQLTRAFGIYLIIYLTIFIIKFLRLTIVQSRTLKFGSSHTTT